MKSNQEISDNDLFRNFVDNNKPESLFRELMGRYKQKVYGQVRRILIKHDDADEVTQIVFIKLWKNADNFKFNSALSSFIYRIAYNESMTFLKQNGRFSSIDEVMDKDGHYGHIVKQGNDLDGNRIMRQLQAALLTLPEKQRLVFNYKYFDDLPYKEISEITGTSEGALKASYHHAVEKIKVFLEKD